MELSTDCCPFCGSDDVLFKAEAVFDTNGVGRFYGYATCNSCHANFTDLGFGTNYDEAVFEGKVHWNQRALPHGLMRRVPGADFDAPVYRCTECGCDVEWKPAWQHCPVCGCLVAGVA